MNAVVYAWRVLRWTALAAALLVLLVLGMVLALLLLPGLVLNEPVLRQAAQWANDHAGVNVEWRRLEVDWEVSEFLGRRVQLGFEDLHIDLGDTGGSFQRTGRISLAYDLRRALPRLREIGPAHLARGHTAVRIAGEDVDEADERESAAPRLPSWLHAARLREVLVQDQTWTVTVGEQTVDGEARMEVTPQSGGGDTIEVRVDVVHRIQAGPARHEGELRLSAHGEGELAPPWHIEMQSAVHGGEFGVIEALVTADIAQRQAHWRTTAQWDHPQASLEARVRGSWKDEGSQEVVHARVDAGIQAARQVDPLGEPRLSIEACQLSWSQAGDRQRLDADCPFALFANGGELSADGKALLAMRLVAGVEAAKPLDAQEPVELLVELVPVDLWLANFGGHARVSGLVVPAAPAPQDLDFDVDLRMEMDEFQRLVDALRDTPWAVPAPLHTLEGPIAMRVRSLGEPPRPGFAAQLTTRLASEHQRLAVDLETRLAPEEGWDGEGPLRLALDADLLLRDVVLRLPPVDVGAMPGIAPDPRIQRRLGETDLANEGSDVFDYSVRVRTDRGHAIELSAPVTGEMIPLAADITVASDEPVRGRIGIGEFPLEVAGFEREVEGGEIFLRLSDVKEEASGGLVFDAEGRTIDMSLAEMTGLFTPLPEPKPPLAIGQIVTSLLVGRAVDVAVVAQGQQDGPVTRPEDAPTALELQYRF